MTAKAIIEVEINPDQAKKELDRARSREDGSGRANSGAGDTRIGRAGRTPLGRSRARQGKPEGILRSYRRERGRALSPIQGGARGVAGRGAERAGTATLGKSGMQTLGKVAGRGGQLAAAVAAPVIASEAIRKSAPAVAGIAQALAATPGFAGDVGKSILGDIGLGGGANINLSRVIERTEELGAALRGKAEGFAAGKELLMDLGEIGALEGLNAEQIEILQRSNTNAAEIAAAKKLREEGARRQQRIAGIAAGFPQTLEALKSFIVDTVRDAFGGFLRR